MNKIISLVLCLTLVLSLTACFETHPPAEPAPPQSEPASVSSRTESSEPEELAPPLHLDYFDAHTITHSDAWDKNEEAVSEWAEYVYQEFGVSEADAAYIGGNVGLSADSDKGCIDVRRYRILLKSETPIPDSYDKGDSEYIINVISIAASPDMQTEQTVIDILSPSRFDTSDHIDEIYECVTEDGRFVDYLLPYKEDVLPEGAVLTDISTLIPEGYASVWRGTSLLDDNFYAVAYVHSITESDGMIVILFVNDNGYKIVETNIRAKFSNYYENTYPWAAKNLMLDDYLFDQGNDHIKVYRYGKADSQTGAQQIDHLMYVYADGTVKEYVGNEAHTAYYTYEYPSDDGKHLIIQEFESIYLADKDSRELLLQMTDEERGEGKFAEYRNWMFVDWFDDDRFICGITGYMGIGEYYLYDLNTRTLTAFEPVENTVVSYVRNGKIILVPHSMAATSNDIYEYDPDTNKATLIEDPPVDFMEGAYSIDGDFFVFAEHEEHPYGDFTIKVYDSVNGELVKSIEGYLHHNRLGLFGYKDDKICGVIERGPFTPTYYAIFE